jgi:hypothetical protein
VIDEVAIWNRALTADEIAAHYANVLAGGNYFSGSDPCDFDGDGMLTVNDVDLLRGEVKAGTDNPDFDVNKDGLVNSGDIETFVTSPEKLNTYIGDANLDGEFNSGDLVTVFAAGKYETGADASWAEGDWDGDGFFATGDLVFAFAGGGYELGARGAVAAVPEPSGILCLLIGLSLVSLRLRHHFST